jgi:hypothetical protein
MKKVTPILPTLFLCGCCTSTVISDARDPKPTDASPWANYLLLPITIPVDIVTSPIQIMAFISYTRGDDFERRHAAQRFSVPPEATNTSTNQATPASESPALK